MEHMKKDLTLPVLAVVGGVAGFALRKWQLAAAYHPETGLFTHGAVPTYLLMGLTALLLLVLLVSVQGKGDLPEDFLPAFACPQSGQMTLWAAAGLLFFAAGLVNLMEGAQIFQLWQATPASDRDPTQLTLTVAQLLCALLSLGSGVSLLMMGKSAYRGEFPEKLGSLVSLPAFTGLLWLFSTHLENGTEPVLMKYGFALTAAALLMLAHYYVAGFCFGRPRPRRAMFFALAGIVLGLTSLADGLTLGASVLTLAFVLSSLAFARALLGNCFGPFWSRRMPFGAEELTQKEYPAE